MAPLYVRSKRDTLPQRVEPQLLPSAREELLPYGLPDPPPGSVQLPAGVSLCLTVKDDAGSLESCLRSVIDYVDEMCVIDLGSSDRTVEIALAAGARLEQRPPSYDRAAARNAVLGMASKRWILMLDVDEQLDVGCGPLVRDIRDIPANLTGLRGRRSRTNGSANDDVVNVFPNSPRLRYLPSSHEVITVDGRSTGIDARVGPISITRQPRADGLSISPGRSS